MKQVLLCGVTNLLLLACTPTPRVSCASAGTPGTVVEPLVRANSATALSIRWLGGPTTTLERGGLAVLTDPMLGPRAEVAFTLPKHPSSGVPNAPVARYTTLPEFNPSGLSAVLISHTHNDHFDETAQRSLPKTLPVVVATAGAEKVRAAGFLNVIALDWGESHVFTSGATSLSVLAIAAHHAHEAQLDHDLGRGNGYLLEWRDPQGTFRAYWTGDTVLSDDSNGFTERYGKVDLLLPHLGGVGGDGGLGLRTMNAEEALGLTLRVQPKWVIPIHHSTFGHYREPIVALEQRAREAKLLPRFRFLLEGERLSLSSD